MVIPGDSVFMITASCSNTFTKPGNRETVKRKKKKKSQYNWKKYIFKKTPTYKPNNSEDLKYAIIFDSRGKFGINKCKKIKLKVALK